MRRLLVGLGTVAIGVAVGSGAATAHVAEDADAPNCIGALTSHAASVHGLTPPERTAIVGAFLGREISVRELQQFVRTVPCP